MRIFLDANILVSVLNKEYPLFTYTSRILSLTDNKRFEVYTSPICLAIAFYFSEKKSGAVLAKRKMELMISKIRIAPVDGQMVSRAIKNKSVADFEDGLEYYAAHAAKCACIITEDVGDFYFSEVEVIQSLPFIEKYVLK
jgi:predicted nucleic acid-binding protein